MDVKTPHMTANAHPAVIAIQPAFCALDLLRSTLATTPLPSRMRTIVPMNSPKRVRLFIDYSLPASRTTG